MSGQLRIFCRGHSRVGGNLANTFFVDSPIKSGNDRIFINGNDKSEQIS